MTLALILLPIAAVLAALVWLRLRAESAPTPKADTQDHILDQNTFETGHSSVYRVTKDPQGYARLFVPRRKGR